MKKNNITQTFTQSDIDGVVSDFMFKHGIEKYSHRWNAIAKSIQPMIINYANRTIIHEKHQSIGGTKGIIEYIQQIRKSADELRASLKTAPDMALEIMDGCLKNKNDNCNSITNNESVSILPYPRWMRDASKREPSVIESLLEDLIQGADAAKEILINIRGNRSEGGAPDELSHLTGSPILFLMMHATVVCATVGLPYPDKAGYELARCAFSLLDDSISDHWARNDKKKLLSWWPRAKPLLEPIWKTALDKTLDAETKFEIISKYLKRLGSDSYWAEIIALPHTFVPPSSSGG